MTEEWRPVPGWPYFASNFGRVKNQEGRLMSLAPLDRGHLVVCLTLNKQHKNHYVHRLVMAAFHGWKDQLVRHLDGNPKNNNLENLAYGTGVENSADMILHGTHIRGERNSQAKLTNEQVLWFKDFYETHILARKAAGYKKAKDGVVKAICRDLNISEPAIERIISGRSWGSVKRSLR